MSVNVANIIDIAGEEEQEPKLSIEDVKSQLIAIGANNCIGSYNSNEKEIATAFFKSSLKVIAPVWPHLNQNAKIAVLDSHIDTFNKWVKNAE